MAALYRDEEKVDMGELLQIWVSPEYRGTRVICDLMDEIFLWAKNNQFQRMITGVTKGNSRALRFYVKYGFSPIEETPKGLNLVNEVK